MRLRVCHTGKDGVILEQALESPEVHLHGDGGEQEAERDSEPAHRSGVLSEHGAALQDAGPAGGQEKEQAHPEREHGQAQQPAGRELPCGKREQIKRDRPAEDGIDAPGAADNHILPVPPERDGRPLAHEAHCGAQCDDRGQEHRDDRKDRPDGEPDGSIVDDDDAVAADLAEPRRLEREKGAVHGNEGRRAGCDEDQALKLEDLPEDLRVAERIEPERVHVVPERGAASEQQHGERDYEEEPGTSASRSLRRKTDRVTIAVVDHGGPTLQADATSIGRNSRESSVGSRQSQSAVGSRSRRSAVGCRGVAVDGESSVGESRSARESKSIGRG